MRKNQLLFISFTLCLSISMILMFQNCSKSLSSVSSSSTQVNNNGTSDGGGGNGLDGRLYESYIVDPTALDATKALILPQLNHINSQILQASSGGGKDPDLTWVDFFKLKTWYIAPVDLAKVSSQTLGTSMIQNATQQLARQTKGEIWIDSRVFNNLNQSDQADLIMHELLMSIYFLKFYPFADLCQFFSKVKSKDMCKLSKDMDSFFPPIESLRELNSDDYFKIRSMTNWTRVAGNQVILSQFYTNLLSNGFDSRLIKFLLEVPEQLNVPSTELKAMFDRAQITNSQFDKCILGSTNQSYSCQTSFQQNLSFTMNGANLIGSQINWNIQTNPAIQINSSPLIFTGITADNSLSLVSITDPVNYNKYFIMLLPTSQMTPKAQIGEAALLGLVIIERDRQNVLWLRAIFRLPRVVLSVTNKPDGTQSCVIGTVTNPELQQDNIAVVNDPNYLTKFMWLFAKSIPDEVYCRP